MTSISTWCRVEAKTIVCCSLAMSSVTRWMNAASLSSCRSWKKASLRSSLILVSVSRRTICGSRKPARANSASICGSVAEKRSVCRWSDMRLRISRSCSANPISKSRSASSRTQYSTFCSDIPSTSERWCSRRPGVATSTSGFFVRSSNCASIESPPTRHVKRRSVYFPKSFANLYVCRASSRVGASNTARAPVFSEWTRNL
mmetsp:Transcript_22682/g.73781  ORF Transcript_22682/g.73781 Transcript_22682/m.73781 type:complete len:202 (+) Transcript_22682:2828-3433(+)